MIASRTKSYFFLFLLCILLAPAIIWMVGWVEAGQFYLVSFLGLGLVLFLLNRFKSSSIADTPFNWNAFAGGFFVRFVFLIALQVGLVSQTGQQMSMGTDAFNYYQEGIKIAELIRQFDLTLHLVVDVIVGGSNFGYSLLNGFIYSIFGNSVLIVKLFNVFLGALLGILVWEIVNLYASKKVARWAVCLTALNPALIYWSALNRKDILYTFLVLLLVLLLLKYLRTKSLLSLLGLIPVSAMTFIVRGNLSYFLGAGLVFILLLNLALKNDWAGLAKLGVILLASVMVLFMLVPAVRSYWKKTLNLDLWEQVISKARVYWRKYEVERLGVKPSQGIEGLVKILPLAAGAFLLSPLPWSAEGIGLFRVPGALVRTFIYPISFFGMYLSLKRDNWVDFLPLIVVPVIVTVPILIVSLGGNTEWQLPMLPFMMIFAGLALDQMSRFKQWYLSYLVLMGFSLHVLFILQTGQTIIGVLSFANLGFLFLLSVILSGRAIKGTYCRQITPNFYRWNSAELL